MTLGMLEGKPALSCRARMSFNIAGLPANSFAGSAHTLSKGYHSKEKKLKSLRWLCARRNETKRPVQDFTPFLSGQKIQSGVAVWYPGPPSWIFGSTRR